MEKYVKTKTQNRRGLFGHIALLIGLAALLALVIWVIVLIGESRIPVLTQIGETLPTIENPEITQAEETVPAESVTAENRTQPTEADPIILTDGLQIRDISSYAGIYMEDGSDESVTDVMMLVLENTSEQDLQLARIDIVYADFTAEFEATNLPAGEKAVLLEKNRHSAVTEEYLSVNTKNVVFFSEPMSLQENKLEIKGTNGVLNVTNISGVDLSGPICIYYKNSASDLLYGGITYRVEIKENLASGETMQIITGHYRGKNSRILQVTIGE